MIVTSSNARRRAFRAVRHALLALAGIALTAPAAAKIVAGEVELAVFRIKTVSAVFNVMTGDLNITLDNNTITDAGGQREAVILTSDATGSQVNIANSLNAPLVTFGNNSFPVLTVTITITGTNPNVAGLGGLVNLAPDTPAVPGYGPLLTFR